MTLLYTDNYPIAGYWHKSTSQLTENGLWDRLPHAIWGP